MEMTEIQKQILLLTQEGIPITPSPYHEIAQQLGITEEEVVKQIVLMKEKGIIRRFGASIGHRDIGITANAMCVWNVPDEKVEDVGRLMASIDDVTHCYARPRYPGWPYNLFTMVHSYSRDDCLDIAKKISKSTGIGDYKVMFSEKEFKKTGIRL
jgi:DNA-binding Lrp family transcriptional regulator